ncbi:MAG: hypothetical protein K0S01_4116 [Herbinix sp.]|jgi:hypothetical protein|nr:hypothetical protein [Herbinix sp.]
MKENEYKVAGYSFSDAHDYKEAKREAETIEYIKANTDLNDLNKAIKLYHKLVERKTLKTVVGFTFLKELQERIVKEGIVSKENMPCIQIDKDEKQLRTYANSLEHEQEQKHLAVIGDYKIKLRNSRIISAFLVGIIIVMIAISIWSDRNIFSNYENKIINKYAAWEEDLNAREQLLEEKLESE